MKKTTWIIGFVILMAYVSLAPSSCDPTQVRKSCMEIYFQDKIFKDGEYTIDPDGAEGSIAPFTVFCDMTTEGGGWTQIEYLTSDSEGYSEKYAAVFSDVASGTLGNGSYKVPASLLLSNATELRYSENDPRVNDSRMSLWSLDYKCSLTSEVKEKIQYPGTMNQAPAPVTCTNLKTNSLSPRAINLNYQFWNGGWNTSYPRLWIGYSATANTYHGDYCVDCVVTWKYGNSTLGVYSSPSSSTNNSGSTVFWLR
jgi:hypothetical protein